MGRNTRWLWLVIGIGMLLPSHLLARTSFYSELLRPTTDNGPYLSTYSSRTLGQYRFSIGGTFDVGHRPLELAGPAGGRVSGIVEDLFMVHLLGSFGILDWFQVGLDFPVAPVDRVIESGTGADRIKFRIGDVRLDLKFRILDPDRYGWGIAAIPFANIPSGDGDNLVGNNSFAGGALLAFETPDLANRVRAALNIGYQIRAATDLFGTAIDDLILYTFAINFRLTDYFEIVPELFGQTVAKDLFESETQSPLEMGAVVRVFVLDQLSLGFGGSAGIVSGAGAPVWRGFAQVAYSPLRRHRIEPKVEEGPRLPLTQAEIYELTKKCPPVDQFDPTLHDSACEKIYELRAIRGKCPPAEEFNPEIHDEACEKVFVLQQYDTDGDGVADYLDRCPDDRGPVENDGCPTHGLVTIDWVEGRVKTDKFLFAFNSYELVPKTREVLDRVASALQPKINYVEKVIVEGHTDSIGMPHYNDWLSKKRADAVKQYLQERGVAASKLQSIGYGQMRPVATNRTEAGQQQNRRVEIKLHLEGQPPPKPPAPLTPAAMGAPEPSSPEAPPLSPMAAPEVPTAPAGEPLIATEPPILDPGLSTGEEIIPAEEAGPGRPSRPPARGRRR